MRVYLCAVKKSNSSTQIFYTDLLTDVNEQQSSSWTCRLYLRQRTDHLRSIPTDWVSLLCSDRDVEQQEHVGRGAGAAGGITATGRSEEATNPQRVRQLFEELVSGTSATSKHLEKTSGDVGDEECGVWRILLTTLVSSRTAAWLLCWMHSRPEACHFMMEHKHGQSGSSVEQDYVHTDWVLKQGRGPDPGSWTDFLRPDTSLTTVRSNCTVATAVILMDNL